MVKLLQIVFFAFGLICLTQAQSYGGRKTGMAAQPIETFDESELMLAPVEETEEFVVETELPALPAPKPISSGYGKKPAPAPVTARNPTVSYGSSATARIPARNPVKSTYGQATINRDVPKPAPVQSSYGQSSLPRDVPKPVQSSYGQSSMSRDVPKPVQSSYGQTTIIRDTPKPVPVQSSYGQTSMTRDEPAPVQSAYGQSSYSQLNRDMPVQKLSCETNPCLNEATCINKNEGGFFCQCPWGWTGAICEVCLTDCKSNPCPANKKCRAFFNGGFECICPSDKTGANCEISQDACSTNPCLNGGFCTARGMSGEFTCDCVQPFSGKTCAEQWINPCTEEVLRAPESIQFPSPWNSDSFLVCVDIEKYEEMKCSGNTIFNAQFSHCVPEDFEAPQCSPNPCQNGGICDLDSNGQLFCNCKIGFTGAMCEVNIDDCASNGYACGSGTCVDQINTYYCLCPNGVGLDCSNTQPNPCTLENFDNDIYYFTVFSSDTNFIQCIGEFSFTMNKCAEGLFWHPEERTCTVEKALVPVGACASLPCKNGGACESLGSTFQCTCKPGYTGSFCEEMIDFCLSNPCMNGGRCLSYAGGYTCVCPDKIIDECCCNGIVNPCPDKSKLIPGVNNYYPHLFPNRYIHCDFDRRAFVRKCPPGDKWRQETLTCASDDFQQAELLVHDEPLQLPEVPTYAAPAKKTIHKQAIVQPTYAAPAPTTRQVPVRQPTTQSYGAVQQKTILKQAPKQSYAAPAQVPILARQEVVAAPSYGSSSMPKLRQPVLTTPKPLVKATYGTQPAIRNPILRQQPAPRTTTYETPFLDEMIIEQATGGY